MKVGHIQTVTDPMTTFFLDSSSKDHIIHMECRAWQWSSHHSQGRDQSSKREMGTVGRCSYTVKPHHPILVKTGKSKVAGRQT